MKRSIAKATLFVGSGKGGVGKSTVAVNLAVSLALEGLKVGLLDADLYGPSIPIMCGLRRMGPEIVTIGNEKRILPFNKFGIQLLSIGFFVEEAKSILFRGPVLHAILNKLVAEVVWGELDILLIDLPPGTGDIPLSLSGLLHVDGALIVTTPQEVAIQDALKMVSALDQLEIPLFGLVENMVGEIFGEGAGEELSKRFGAPFLGKIPLDSAIRRGGDAGIPSAFHAGESNVGRAFREISLKLLQGVEA